MEFQLVREMLRSFIRRLFDDTAKTDALMEVTEHVIRGRLRCGIIVLIFRINVQAIGKEVQVEVFEVSFTELNVELQLLLIQALEEVHS